MDTLPPEISMIWIGELDLASFANLLQTSTYWNTFLDPDFQNVFSGMNEWITNSRELLNFGIEALRVSDICLYLFSTKRIDLVKKFISWFGICAEDWEISEITNSIAKSDNTAGLKLLLEYREVDILDEEFLGTVLHCDAVKIFEFMYEPGIFKKICDKRTVEEKLIEYGSVNILTCFWDDIFYDELYLSCLELIETNGVEILNMFVQDDRYDFSIKDIYGNTLAEASFEYIVDKKSIECAKIMCSPKIMRLCSNDLIYSAIDAGNEPILKMILDGMNYKPDCYKDLGFVENAERAGNHAIARLLCEYDFPSHSQIFDL